MDVVERTLAVDLGVKGIPIVMALNKIDAVSGGEEQEVLANLQMEYPDAICISAVGGTGVASLLDAIKSVLDRKLIRLVVCIPYTQGALISRFYEVATVEAEAHEEDCVRLTGVLASESAANYQDFVVSVR